MVIQREMEAAQKQLEKDNMQLEKEATKLKKQARDEVIKAQKLVLENKKLEKDAAEIYKKVKKKRKNQKLLDENKLKQDIKATKASKAMAANKNKFTLPNGWTTETKQRTTGKTAGQKDIFYISPDKQQKFNSLVKVEFFIKTTSSSSSSSSSSANVVSSSALELATALANVKKYQEEAKKYQDNLGQIQICYQQYADATTLKDRTKFEHDMRHFIFKLKISEENTKKKN